MFGCFLLLNGSRQIKFQKKRRAKEQMLNYIFMLFVYVTHMFAYVLIYQKISKNKLSLLSIGLLVFLFILSYEMINYFSFIPIFCFFYLHAYRKNNKEEKQLLWFYSIYTTLVTSLLANVFLNVVAFFLGEAIFLKYLILINLIAPLFPVVVNDLMIRFLRPNIDFLQKNSHLINNLFLKVINVILTICCIIQYTNYWFENFIEGNPIRSYLLVVFIGIIVVLLGYLGLKNQEINNRQIQQLKDEQINDLGNYIKHIEELYDNIRGFQHDYQNMLISLNESIKTKDVEIIEDTYQHILKNEHINLQEERYHLAKLNHLKILAVKGIISTKITKALQQDIKVALEITEPIEETIIDLLDYIRILSIMIDNAIEAATLTSDPRISIAFIKSSQQEEQKIIIENSCIDQNMNIAKIYEQGYSTKGENRGIGLATLKNIFNNYYNLTLETECANYRFCQTITIKKVVL